MMGINRKTERAATEEETKRLVMSWKLSGKKSCQEGGSDQLKQMIRFRKRKLSAVSKVADGLQIRI